MRQCSPLNPPKGDFWKCLTHENSLILIHIFRCLKIHFIYFSSLEGMTLVKYYSLLFQIEFNFRAAKQHFGLSDFKNIKPIQVSNAIGPSFFMDNLSTVLIQDTKEKSKLDFLSILDIKVCFRAIFFSQRLNNTPVLSITNILDPQNIKMLANLGIVNMFNNSNMNNKVAWVPSSYIYIFAFFI